MVHENKEAVKAVEDDEEGYNNIEVGLEKPSSMQSRSSIETKLDFSLFMESEEFPFKFW